MAGRELVRCSLPARREKARSGEGAGRHQQPGHPPASAASSAHSSSVPPVSTHPPPRSPQTRCCHRHLLLSPSPPAPLLPAAAAPAEQQLQHPSLGDHLRHEEGPQGVGWHLTQQLHTHAAAASVPLPVLRGPHGAPGTDAHSETSQPWTALHRGGAAAGWWRCGLCGLHSRTQAGGQFRAQHTQHQHQSHHSPPLPHKQGANRARMPQLMPPADDDAQSELMVRG